MRGRLCIVMCAVVALASQAPTPVVAQTDTENWTLPRTPWGDPDLQDVWSFATITPLERPTDLAAKTDLTDTEVAQLNLDARTRSQTASRAPSLGLSGKSGPIILLIRTDFADTDRTSVRGPRGQFLLDRAAHALDEPH